MEQIEDVTNVTSKTEKNVKSKSKKGEKNEYTAKGTHEAQNISSVGDTEHVQIFGKEDIVEIRRDRKKHKNKKNKEGKLAESDINGGSEKGELTVACGEDSSRDAMVNVEKKRKKREKDNSRDDKLNGECISEISSIGQHSHDPEVHGSELVERKKKKKEKKKNRNDNNCEDTFNESKHDESDLPSVQQENVPGEIEGNIESTKQDGRAAEEHKRKKKKNKKKEHNVDNDSNGGLPTDEMQSNDEEYARKKKKKYKRSLENGSDDLRDNGVESNKKRDSKETDSVENGSNKSNKKVRFSDQSTVFRLPDDSNTEADNYEEENLVRGKRFTPEEDEIVKQSVLDYIDKRNLGDEGLDMVLNCKKHSNLRGCWREIASAIPYRPYLAIYYRAQIIFGRSESRTWTKEEYDEILKLHEEYGNGWKKIGKELGKHRVHVKDTWRRIKLTSCNKGHWSQEEYQGLFDLVKVDLISKLSEEKRSKHGMLRDNICWTAISDKLSTRSQSNCCVKWYKQLTSSMVTEGIWADTDDYRLIGALYRLDATCVEDVDWDCLVEDRSGDVCRKRWDQMVMHIGRHGLKPFAEKVEVLAQRYCPNLLEAREIWDSKPRVP